MAEADGMGIASKINTSGECFNAARSFVVGWFRQLF